MSIYIIGAKKGLGKFIFEKINSIAINRNNINKIKNSKKNIFIICANNKYKYPDYKNFYNFYSDNILLIEKISKMKHSHIIYMSSIEVYYKNYLSEKSNLSREDYNPYAMSKIIAENIIINNTKNYTILRLGALLGKYSNNLIARIINKKIKKTTLHEKSTFNYILYDDVLLFIKKIIKNHKSGIYNLVSNTNVTLKYATKLTNRNIKFGKYKYITYKTKNNKIKDFNNYFDKTSKQNLLEFINAYK